MKSIVTFVIVGMVVFNGIASEFKITDFGAVPDSKTLCTDFIQRAIDDCSLSGGGKVIVSAGRFLSGTIFLKNNVNLYLERGAVLLGSTRIEDYKPDILIRGQNVENISITGFGTIDGQGDAFWIPEDRSKIPYERVPQWIHKNPRPGNLIRLTGCRNAVIEDVLLTGSESWTLHLLGCDNVMVTGIKIRNPLHGPNTDGIDIQACRNVIISNCDIYTRDDAICLKNRDSKYYDRDCENITITNCIITTLTNAFKIGTESLGNFRNIVFSNSVIKAARPSDELAKEAATWIDTTRQKSGIGPSGGIAIESVDGAHIQGLTITNIVMDGVWTPIFIRLANRGAGAQKVSPPVPGSLKDVMISNIVAYRASSASSITAIPGYYVENVSLRNISIRTQGGGDEKMASIVLDEKIDAYPDAKMWKEMPVTGFFVRHAKNIQMSDITVFTDKEDYRPAMKFDDVIQLTLDNIQTDDLHLGKSVLDFLSVKNVNIRNTDFPTKHYWFQFAGPETENIKIQSMNQQIQQLINLENSVNNKSVLF
jgi:polygalacturonase